MDMISGMTSGMTRINLRGFRELMNRLAEEAGVEPGVIDFLIGRWPLTVLRGDLSFGEAWALLENPKVGAGFDFKSLLREFDFSIQLNPAFGTPRHEHLTLRDDHVIDTDCDLRATAREAWSKLGSAGHIAGSYCLAVLVAIYLSGFDDLVFEPPVDEDQRTDKRHVDFDPIIRAFRLLISGFRRLEKVDDVYQPQALMYTAAVYFNLRRDPAYEEYTREFPLMLTYYTGESYPEFTALDGAKLLRELVRPTEEKGGQETVSEPGNPQTPTTTEDQRFSLHDLAKQGNNEVEAYARALREGADLEAQRGKGTTAIMWAAQNCSNPDVVRFLASSGAKLDAADDLGRTALINAAGFNDNAEVLSALLEAGAATEAQEVMYGATALMYAAAFRAEQAVEAVTSLVDAGADLEALSNQGRTVLLFAAQHTDNADVIRTLLAAGANSKATDEAGKGALDIARTECVIDNSEVVAALEAAG